MRIDLLLAGAGLASALIALRVAEARPGARIRLVEQAERPPDAHTWCFHATDLTPAWHRRLASGLRARWEGQEVRFADHRRALRAGYASLDDAGLARLLAAAEGIEVVRGAPVAALDAGGATLRDGTRMDAACVIDGRGAAPSRHLVTAWQKFLGIEFETEAPHGLARPVIMDATVPQIDGYRFVYLLPFSPTRLLVEDTRYSDGPALDDAAAADEVRAYAEARGWRGTEARRERGVLPIALAHDAAGLWQEAAGGAVPVGLRAGLFHPVTGYSLPVAARVADVVAESPLATGAVFAAVRDFALPRAREDRFLRLLNRMLFRGCPPEARHRVLSRFYRLPEPLIERFYAGRLTALDRLRIVAGKPPIPVSAALPCLREAPLLATAR
ncbi:lycopene beta-cyclase CrtY [Amaricoccus solimangrovi]|uniref:Lycopene beta-cyclase CrtY n=1 Tax=Amaricoccus solimangrovi TaxID=2589815 RepID=A0A501WDJ7_9RHOB|nr:lycopene beta-cyclase CrtY [Amaricoccus solimangrovi]TPE46460.1 lycopene beta-cyclase CrtY [Amaricoccus solimangrovi]